MKKTALVVFSAVGLLKAQGPPVKPYTSVHEVRNKDGVVAVLITRAVRSDGSYAESIQSEQDARDAAVHFIDVKTGLKILVSPGAKTHLVEPISKQHAEHLAKAPTDCESAREALQIPDHGTLKCEPSTEVVFGQPSHRMKVSTVTGQGRNAHRYEREDVLLAPVNWISALATETLFTRMGGRTCRRTNSCL